MKIVIVGAGQVGSTLAENLASENNDITLIDINPQILTELQDRLDIRTIAGTGSYPSVLEAAGIADADLLIAVTNSDETNMIACQIAYSLYKTPVKIARVRSAAYSNARYKDRLFTKEHIPIDVLITPEQVVTNHIMRLLEHPGALQVLDFADDKAQLVGVRAVHDGPLVGHSLSVLRQHMPKVDTRVAAIFRNNKPIAPEGDTVVEAGDEVFFIAAKGNIRAVMGEMRRLENPYHRIMIAGGGNVGFSLAKQLERDHNIKIIEFGLERAEVLSERLSRTVVLKGSATDRELLLEENIENTDVFLAVTNDDRVNIMSSLLAKRLGAKKVMAIINSPVYADMMQGGEIDIAISPQQATVSSLLTHVRRGDTVRVHTLRRGAAEAMEVIAHGDKRNSRVVGRALEDIRLPKGVTIGALVRNGKVLIAHHDTVIEQDDHVIVFLVDRGRIREVEKLFTPGFTFF